MSNSRPPLSTSDFDYALPNNLIAQTPVEPRDASRLMVVDRSTGSITHRAGFSEITEELRAGDVLALNTSRVLPARLYGRRADTRGKVELLLLQRLEPNLWLCMGKPGRTLHPGVKLVLQRGSARVDAEVVRREENGLRAVRFSDESALEQVGHTPLPPYIHTPLTDPERYQTVYARERGSAAAPTAGLHFTPELLARLRAQGVQTAEVTLHVGLDTFRPVQSEDPREHHIHTEYWAMSAGAAATLNAARVKGNRIIAVGTTSARVLEQAAKLAAKEAGSEASWRFTEASGWADLFILPGHRFLAVDALLTNFHLPRSTLLMLVCAFAACHPEQSEGSAMPPDPARGRELILRAYQEAIAQRYRFYSFGDAMIVV
jgi:S-adenosylmethionine:tRNA ribosyltransferase-isomerase